MRRHTRRGFALLTVLWTLSGLGVLSLALLLTARSAVTGAQARIDWHRAAWRAEGCAAILRSHLDAAMADEPQALARWRALDAVAATAVLPSGCTAKLTPAGTGLNVNTASREAIWSVLAAEGVPSARADSMAAALIDWRDADDEASPAGAEHSWYAQAGRLPPRNGDLGDADEMHHVRGFEDRAGSSLPLGVGAERIPLSHASLPVLMSLPGITPDVAQAIIRRRSDPTPGSLSLGAIALSVGDASARELMGALPVLGTLVVDVPEAWDVTIHASEGTPAMSAALHLRLRNGGTRAALVTQRFAP